MALLVFRSRAAAEILMQSDQAERLLHIIGKAVAERGVITVAQLGEALSRLERATVPAGSDASVPTETAPAAAHDPAAAPSVSLRQRAFPLMQMLRAAQRRQTEVTWGI